MWGDAIKLGATAVLLGAYTRNKIRQHKNKKEDKIYNESIENLIIEMLKEPDIVNQINNEIYWNSKVVEELDKISKKVFYQKNETRI